MTSKQASEFLENKFMVATTVHGSPLIAQQFGSPLVRTNPVTSWKSLFGVGHQVDAGYIEGVTERESEILKAYCKYRGFSFLH